MRPAPCNVVSNHDIWSPPILPLCTAETFPATPGLKICVWGNHPAAPSPANTSSGLSNASATPATEIVHFAWNATFVTGISNVSPGWNVSAPKAQPMNSYPARAMPTASGKYTMSPTAPEIADGSTPEVWPAPENDTVDMKP